MSGARHRTWPIRPRREATRRDAGRRCPRRTRPVPGTGRVLNCAVRLGRAASVGARGSLRVPGQAALQPRRHSRLRGAARADSGGDALGGPVVVKAEVLTGGRGKAGGIKLADDPADAEAKAKEILGLDIRGHVVEKLWIEKASDIAREYYLSVTFDRGAKQPLFMFTTQGGVEIEQVAEENPDALVRLHIDPLEGFQPWVARRLVYEGKVEDPSEQKQIAAIVGQLYEAFVEFDAMLCEINPLIVTPEGEVKALDSKFTVDDSALARHPDIAEWRDTSAADP